MNVNLDDLAKIINILNKIFKTPYEIFSWLNCPNPGLGGIKPRIAIIDGDSGQVLKILQNLQQTNLYN